MKSMTESARLTLVELMVQHSIDQMDLDALITYAADKLTLYFSHLTPQNLLDEAKEAGVIVPQDEPEPNPTPLAWLNEDIKLTQDDLDSKYNQDGDGEHPFFTRWDWIQAVAQRSTLSSYWAWLQYKIDDLYSQMVREGQL